MFRNARSPQRCVTLRAVQPARLHELAGAAVPKRRAGGF
jgi:hypothetical protein